jgi:hypothetical protein
MTMVGWLTSMISDISSSEKETPVLSRLVNLTFCLHASNKEGKEGSTNLSMYSFH